MFFLKYDPDPSISFLPGHPFFLQIIVNFNASIFPNQLHDCASCSSDIFYCVFRINVSSSVPCLKLNIFDCLSQTVCYLTSVSYEENEDVP